MLEDISDDSKEEINTDFSGQTTATIYESNLTEVKRIISGTNFISIGTNSAWRFDISTTENLPNSRLKVICRGKNGQSILTITPNYNIPTFVSEPPAPQHVLQEEDIQLDNLSINLIVPNGLCVGNIDERIEGMDFSANNLIEYFTNIDTALLDLIEAQQQQFPLTKK
jgi:hypothetical protein